MSIEFSTDLPPALVPVAWLLGTWEGVGVATAAGAEYQFGELVTFAHDGQPWLSYESTVWKLDAEGKPGEPDARETGFWRVQPDGALEVLLASAAGAVEIYAGSAEGARIEIATDLVGRTVTAAPYTAGKRLYGSVEGDLLYAFDAAFEGDGRDGLAPLRSARLRKVLA